MTTSRLGALRAERVASCASLRALGPDAPTLCGDWNALDLAAHLALQELGRGVPLLLTYPTVLLPLLATGIRPVRLERVRDVRTKRIAERLKRRGFDWLVGRLERGPPGGVALPGVATVRVWENFVHHEDLRRAQPSWAPRRLPPDVEELLWRSLWWLGRYHRRLLEGVAAEVRSEGRSRHLSQGPAAVSLTGSPGELVLFLSGRASAAHVQLEGDRSAIDHLCRRPMSI
jgi:uncharacterized protein (TIGR03085 family)